jgi:hypothetical protein
MNAMQTVVIDRMNKLKCDKDKNLDFNVPQCTLLNPQRTPGGRRTTGWETPG